MGTRKRGIGYDARRHALVVDPSVKLTALRSAKGTEIAELTPVGNKLKDLLFGIENVVSVGFDDSEKLEDNPSGFFSIICGRKAKVQIFIRYSNKNPLPWDEGTDNLMRKIIQALDLISAEEFLDETLESISDGTIEEFLDSEPEPETEANHSEEEEVEYFVGETTVPIRGAKLIELPNSDPDQPTENEEESTEVLDFVEAFRRRTGYLPPSCY